MSCELVERLSILLVTTELGCSAGFLSVAILMSVTRNCCVGVFSVVSIHQHDQATFRPHHSPESLVWNKASVHYKPSMAGCYENLMRGLMAILTQIRGGNVWIMNTALHHWHHFRWQISWRDQSVQSLTSSFRHHHAMSNIIRMIETDQVIMTVWGIINVSTEGMFVVLCYPPQLPPDVTCPRCPMYPRLPDTGLLPRNIDNDPCPSET